MGYILERLLGRENRVRDKINVLRSKHDTNILPRFAVLCAGHVLSNFERVYPNDDRPRKAIESAEAYLTNPSALTAISLKPVAGISSIREGIYEQAATAGSAIERSLSSALDSLGAVETAVGSIDYNAANPESHAPMLLADLAYSTAVFAARSARHAAHNGKGPAAECAERSWQYRTLMNLINEGPEQHLF
jgi:hypothetical protein